MGMITPHHNQTIKSNHGHSPGLDRTGNINKHLLQLQGFSSPKLCLGVWRGGGGGGFGGWEI